MIESTGTRAPQEKVCGYEYTVKRGDSFYLIAHRLGIPLRDLLEANTNINPARLMVGDVLCIPMEEDDAPVPETQIPAQPAPAEQEAPADPETPASPESSAEPEIITEVPEDTAEPESVSEPETAVQPEAAAQPESVVEEYITIEEENLDMPAAEAVQEQTAPPSCASGNPHTVAQGETVADIQMDTGLSYHTLQTANPTVPLEQLTAGEVLCIPEENIPCPTATTYLMQTGESLETIALKLNLSLGALLRANPCLAPADFVEGACITVPDA